MGGIILDQALPLRGIDQVDPFLLIHHWKQEMKGGELPQNLGVGPHPHRGFAPVTFIFEGGVHHRDSTGHESIVMKGGTQWMNSGRGIIHSERPPKALAQEGGTFEIIQFWVNAPKSKKMSEPSYQPLSESETPTLKADGGKIEVGVVSGAVGDTKGIIDTYSPLTTLRLNMKAGGRYTLPIEDGFNTLFYQLDGQTLINDEKRLDSKEMAVFEASGSEITIEAQTNGRAIVLAGKPIGEPVVSYGPFVMNSEQEIMQAMRDYQTGKLGTLVEKF